MNIFLFEKKSSLNNHRPNLALARFSTIHKSKGDSVYHFVLDSNFKMPADIIPELVYISIVFSWDVPYFIDFINKLMERFPHLKEEGKIRIGGIAPFFMGDYIKEQTGIEAVRGCSYELDHVIPDPDFYDNNNTYLFTMRGCTNGCPWCVVPKVEGNANTSTSDNADLTNGNKAGYIIKNWRDQINMKAKNVVIMDNNLFTAPIEHRKEVFNYLTQIAHRDGVRVEGSRKIRTVEFDGGFDFRALTEENIELIKNIRFSKIRVAFDSISYEKEFDSAITRLLEVFPEKSKRGMHEKFECFVLYNCNFTKDTLEDTLYRIYKLRYHYGIFPYLMRFQPLDTLQYKTYVSPYWNEQDCVDIARWTNSRQVFMKTPRYMYYHGRKADGTCISKTSEIELRVLNSLNLSNLPIDFSKSYKDNLNIIQDELKRRDDLLNGVNKQIEKIQQLRWVV